MQIQCINDREGHTIYINIEHDCDSEYGWSIWVDNKEEEKITGLTVLGLHIIMGHIIFTELITI